MVRLEDIEIKGVVAFLPRAQEAMPGPCTTITRLDFAQQPLELGVFSSYFGVDDGGWPAHGSNMMLYC